MKVNMKLKTINIPKEGIFSELSENKLKYINEFFNEIEEKTSETWKVENTEHKKYLLNLVRNDFIVKIGAYIENKYSQEITQSVKQFLHVRTNH
jgi:hypothetical protein